MFFMLYYLFYFDVLCCSKVTLSTDTSRHMHKLHSRQLGRSWILCKSESSILVINCLCICKRVPLTSRLQHIGVLSAAPWLPHPECYHLLVFFLHLCLIALKSRKETFEVSKMLLFLSFPFLKLHKLKLCKQRNVCTLMSGSVVY